MKKDLELIKKKIEHSGVKAPGNMDESYVIKTLEGVSPHPVEVTAETEYKSGTAATTLYPTSAGFAAAAVHPRQKRRIVAIAFSATAAVLVAVIALSAVLRYFNGGGQLRTVSLPGGLGLKQFVSYAQVRQEFDRIRKENNRGNGILEYFSGGMKGADSDYYVSDSAGAAEAPESGSSMDPNGSSAASFSHSETYEQVSGVSEADIIKTDGRYIYCVDYNKIVVFSAEGEASKRAATIKVNGTSTATEDEPDFDYESYYGSDMYISEIYLRDDRMIVLCEAWAYDDDAYIEKTIAQVYDISDIESVTLLDSITQSGSYASSRMIGDKLYIVSSYYPYDDRIIPVCGRGDDPEGVPADCIYSLAYSSSESFLVLSAYDTLDLSARTETKSIMGAVDNIYCNENNMYIYSTVWDDSYTYSDTESTGSQILKVDLTDSIAFTAYAKVDGTISSQYALDEYNGKLRVATTSPDFGKSYNNLYVLDEELSVIGSVTGFAEQENIMAVRYLGDTAYVITYKQVDPLFVIDLSDPTAPEILGEVEISGFSSMLVPIDENTLLGIGTYSNGDFSNVVTLDGVKLALFDVSDKTDPKVLDSLTYVGCESEVQYEPKALVYNPDRDDYLIPLNGGSEWDYIYDEMTDDYENELNNNGGLLNFRIEDGKLVQIDRVTDNKSFIERCVYVGDTIYMMYHDEYSNIQIDSVKYR